MGLERGKDGVGGFCNCAMGAENYFSIIFG